MLQVGGEQEAVTDPAPAEGVPTAQDSVQPVASCTTEGWVAVQVKGILLSVTCVPESSKELFPMTSVRTALAVCAVPLEVTKLVWPVCRDPAGPSSSVMFWIGQVSKKSRSGEVTPWEFVYC